MQHFRKTALSAIAATALAASALAGAGTSALAGASAPAMAAPSPDLSVTNATATLQQLQNIADKNNGNRSTGTPGYKASVDWVKGKLEAAGYTTTLQSFSTRSGTSYNLIAETAGGDPNHVVMTGSHLDSVAAGPGINDNGTGSAAVLEAALAWKASGLTPRNKLRFAWWGAEEQGLLGSNYYMKNLPTAQKDKIELYMNFDMVGSPNPGYFVYDDNAAGNAARDRLTAYYDSKSIPWEYVDVQGRSDHASFRSYGIPTTGLDAGVDDVKTAAQARKWGGQSGRTFDPCYHRACDNMSNINSVAFDRHLDAIGHMVWLYADENYGSTTPPTTTPPTTTPPTTTPPTTTPPNSGNLLLNPGFESGATNWTGSDGPITTNADRPARTGTWKMWLGGNGKTATETISQDVTIPSNASRATLSYWIRSDTSERGTRAYDTMKIQIVSAGSTSTLKTYSNASTNSTYTQFSHDLSSYKGKTVTVRFLMNEDTSQQTSFVVDDTSVNAS